MWTLIKFMLRLLVLLIFIGGPIGIVLLIIYALKTGPRRRREQYQKFADGIGGEMVLGPKGNPLCARVIKDGIEIKVSDQVETEVHHHHDFSDGGIETDRRTFQYFIMESPGNFGFNVFLTKDSTIFKLAQKLGKVTDIEIGDPEFDKKYLISAKDPAPVAAFFSSHARRGALNALFDLNFKEFWVSPDSIIIRKGFQPSKDLIPANLQQYVNQFYLLVKG